jgi:hypothetical protein
VALAPEEGQLPDAAATSEAAGVAAEAEEAEGEREVTTNAFGRIYESFTTPLGVPESQDATRYSPRISLVMNF